jgi:hypothetical protein
MTLADRRNMVDASGWYIFSTDMNGNGWDDLQNSWGITFAEIESKIFSISSSSPIDISTNGQIPEGAWNAYDISTNPIIAPYTPYWVHVVNPNYGMTRIIEYDNIGDRITKYIDVRGVLGYTSYDNTVDNKTMVSVTVGDLVDTISYNAFADSSVLLVNISNKVEDIQSEAFLNCSSLTTVIFQDGSQVVTIDDIAFNGCTEFEVYMTLSLYNQLYSQTETSIPNTPQNNFFGATYVTIKPLYELTKYTV